MLYQHSLGAMDDDEEDPLDAFMEGNARKLSREEAKDRLERQTQQGRCRA